MHIASRAARMTIAMVAAGTIAAGCLPYTVGSTARPVPRGTLEFTGSFYSIPGAFEYEDEYDSTSVPLVGIDLELRYGIDDYSDLGLRFPTASGVILTYKRRLNGRSHDGGAALAAMAGGGLVNLGEHGLVELTVLASGQDRDTWTPFGGLRGMHVIPLTRYAVSDRPTAGGFLGVRLGTADFGISPEIGIYYDPSALELRKRRVIFVPAVSLHAAGWLDAIRRRQRYRMLR